MRLKSKYDLQTSRILLPLCGIIFLIISAVFYGNQSKWIVFSFMAIRVTICLFLLIVPGFYLIRLISIVDFSASEAFIMSIPCSIGLYCLIFLMLFNLQAPAFVYTFFFFGIVGTILFFTYRRGIFGSILKIDMDLRLGIVLVLIGSIVALSYVLVDIERPRKEINQLSVADRGFHTLPIDNKLQYDVAKTFANYRPAETCRWDTWHISDRPPLLGVVNAFVAMVITNPRGYNYWEYQVVSTILNVIYLLPLTALAAVIFKNKTVGFLVPMAVFLNGFIFLNSYYTWPKLFGVFFVLTSLVIVLKSEINLKTSVISGYLWGLGSICHAGVFLSLPAIFLLYIVAPIHHTKKKLLIPFLATIILLNLPWALYKAANSPDRNVLLKTHFIPGAKYEEPVLKGLIGFFSKVSLHEQVKHRFDNLEKFLKNNAFLPSLKVNVSGNWNHYHRSIYPSEFFHPLTVIGPNQVLICLAILLVLMGNRLIGAFKFEIEIDKGKILFWLSFVIISYFLNIMAKWTDPINHELPYFEMVLAISLVAGFSFSFGNVLKWISMGLIFLRFGHYLVYTSVKHKFYVFDFYNLCVIAGVAAMMWACLKFSHSNAKVP